MKKFYLWGALLSVTIFSAGCATTSDNQPAFGGGNPNPKFYTPATSVK